MTRTRREIIDFGYFLFIFWRKLFYGVKNALPFSKLKHAPTCICTDKHDRWGRLAAPGGNRVNIRHNIVCQSLILQIKGEQRVEEWRRDSQFHEVDSF